MKYQLPKSYKNSVQSFEEKLVEFFSQSKEKSGRLDRDNSILSPELSDKTSFNSFLQLVKESFHRRISLKNLNHSTIFHILQTLRTKDLWKAWTQSQFITVKFQKNCLNLGQTFKKFKSIFFINGQSSFSNKSKSNSATKHKK